jgi:flagellar hook-associated protein 1 FlgK
MSAVNSLMDLARQTLMNDQAALGVVANNVSNVNTPGYTRQVVSWQTRDSVQIGSSSVGEGAKVTISSMRDRVLEQRLQQQIQTQAQSSTLTDTLSQIESVFGLSDTTKSASSTQIGSALDSFYSALSSLSSKPSDSSVRQAVLSAAKGVADAFNAASNQLAGITSDLDQQVTGTVDNINSLLSTIASLNKQITSISPNSDAGVLEDQRQQAISQLSQYVGLNQITNENNGLTITTTNGAVLVSADQSYPIGTTQVGGVTHLLAGATGMDITSGVTGGSLGGILQARDQLIPSYKSSLDTLAYNFAAAVNQINSQGLDTNGNAGGAIFTLPGSSTGAASQIQLATTDPAAIAAAAVGEGATGNGNALLLQSISTTAIVSGQTAMDFFSSLLTQVGTAAADASNNNTAQETILSQLTSTRNALSSVSLDEEAANLAAYQRAYQAAAKVFSVADSIMASALNLGVNTSVS